MVVKSMEEMKANSLDRYLIVFLLRGITVISREKVFKQYSVLKLLHDFGNILRRLRNPKIPTTKQHPTPLKRPGLTQCTGQLKWYQIYGLCQDVLLLVFQGTTIDRLADVKGLNWG